VDRARCAREAEGAKILYLFNINNNNKASDNLGELCFHCSVHESLSQLQKYKF
jgi:hypothetical protein